MCVIHAIDEKTVRVDGTPAGLACDAGKSRAPFPTATATAAETSFNAGQRTLAKRLRAISKFIPGTMF